MMQQNGTEVDLLTQCCLSLSRPSAGEFYSVINSVIIK